MATGTLPGQFVPYPEGGPSPGPISSMEGVESREMVDLREVPIGTIIQFHGLHPGSKYLAKVVEDPDARGDANKRKIVLWLGIRAPPAIGSIDEIVSAPGMDLRSPECVRGVMKLRGFADPRIRGYYLLPNFYFEDDHLYGAKGVPLRLVGGPEGRLEPYTKIFVMLLA